MKNGPESPAFPDPSIVSGLPTGLTLREYFAAHAPAEPQPWFLPTMSTPRPKAQWPEKAGGRIDPINSTDIQAWNNECVRQCCLQWPWAWAWADAVLAARTPSSPAPPPPKNPA